MDRRGAERLRELELVLFRWAIHLSAAVWQFYERHAQTSSLALAKLSRLDRLTTCHTSVEIYGLWLNFHSTFLIFSWYPINHLIEFVLRFVYLSFWNDLEYSHQFCYFELVRWCLRFFLFFKVRFQEEEEEEKKTMTFTHLKRYDFEEAICSNIWPQWTEIERALLLVKIPM